MKPGDSVRLVGMPSGLTDDDTLQTRSLFESCIGKRFVIADIETLDGVPQRLVQLDVGHILGVAPYMHTIWVEEEYLEIEKIDLTEEPA